jgi:hypothetical protein
MSADANGFQADVLQAALVAQDLETYATSVVMSKHHNGKWGISAELTFE